MADLSREEQIRAICLEQAVILYSSVTTRTYAPSEVLMVAKEFETYVRGIYRKGDAAPQPIPVDDEEDDPMPSPWEEPVVMKGKEDRDPTN